jgi:hypothetical protein
MPLDGLMTSFKVFCAPYDTTTPDPGLLAIDGSRLFFHLLTFTFRAHIANSVLV